MKRDLIYRILALVFSLWFLLAGWIWVYYINIIFVFPFAIIGFILWRRERNQKASKLNVVTGWALVTGLIVSIVSLGYGIFK